MWVVRRSYVDLSRRGCSRVGGDDVLVALSGARASQEG